MNRDQKVRVIHLFAAQLQDNHGQRLTEALVQGLLIKLELLLPEEPPEPEASESPGPAPSAGPAGQTAADAPSMFRGQTHQPVGA